MKHLKTYELFGFGSKKTEKKSWKEKFQDVVDYWNKIKNHQLNGFSVSGFFAEEPANFMTNEEMFLYAVAEILKSS